MKAYVFLITTVTQRSACIKIILYTWLNSCSNFSLRRYNLPKTKHHNDNMIHKQKCEVKTTKYNHPI